MNYFLIAIGSALGGMARHWCGTAITARVGTQLPWGTLVVNVTGSLLIGALAALVDPPRWQAPAGLREFLMIGVLGGYTTFSAFSLQTLMLLRQAQWAYAAWNVALSMFLCLGAVALGYGLVTVLHRAPGS